MRPAPGVRGALGTLHASGLRLGLISNLVNETSASAAQILQDLGLDEYYASRQFSPDLPWSKPDPGPFRACLKELGVIPEVAVHIGDRAVDRRGARRAGMRAIVYTGLHRREFGRTRPRAEDPVAGVPSAASWNQVVRIVDRLGPRPGDD